LIIFMHRFGSGASIKGNSIHYSNDFSKKQTR